jgi:hypothetical protein
MNDATDKKDVKITTYFDRTSASKLLEESQRTGVAAASLIRFHTLRSINNPTAEELAGTNRNARPRNIRVQ